MQEHVLPSVLNHAPRAGLLARLDAWLGQHPRRALEAWLGTSQNVAELEARMRDLSRAVPHPYY